ncbi:hypothetical protein Pfo_011069 [Paulownia fortunei]|nr:hypothetical protein Pfo_011069 [Paulownia fortunei]
MAYAAVVSLKQTINRLLNPSQISRILLPNSDMEFIYEEVCCLQSFLETISSSQSSERVDALERQIKDAAHKFEDLIESHVSDRFLSESESSRDESLTLAFSQELLKVRQEISSFTKTLKTEEEYNTEDQQPSNSIAADAVSSRIDSGRKNKMVGLDDELLQLQNWVSYGSPELEIMSIVGMAGIGKTTLTKNIYCDPYFFGSFCPRFFVTIGPKYQLKEFLLLALDRFGFLIDEMHGKKDKELGRYLYRFLEDTRYLIVLDDIWSTQVWKELKQFFPKNEKGSRIILTTRLLDVAGPASTNKNIIQIPFLNDDQSWNLLREVVFNTEESCNRQLEKIGRKIAKKCEGLPLAIVEVGNLLCKTEKTVENWEKVAENEDPLIIRKDDDTPISKALSLSYKHLPLHIKACFLYMGVFPPNYEIPTSKLFKLWASEGLFDSQWSKDLEKMAEKCLNDLVSRSLVLVREPSSRGRTKTCKIHFVYRNLCVSEAQNEKFFHIINKYANSFPEGTNSQRRLCIHNNIALSIKQVHSSMESVSAARSLLCLGPQHQYPLRVVLHHRLLRVLDALTIRFYKFPRQVLKLVQLRYLAITYDGELPASISRLWNLEVLIVHRHQNIKSSKAPVYLPIEIWNLHRLRHLQCMGFDMPDPSTAARGDGDGCDDSLILKSLLTLSGVSAQSCTKGVLARKPNLMKLGIRIESTHDAVETFSFLGDFTSLYDEFGSFKCIIVNPGLGSRVVSFIPGFPINLRKITLSGCGFSWESMRHIGKLPKLEVVKLRWYACRGPEWKTYEGEFPRLKFLLLEDLDIQHWTANRHHFPSLTRLIIRHCYKLREFPWGIGLIPTLEMIEVDDCSPSVVISAQQMQEELEQYGDTTSIYFSQRVLFQGLIYTKKIYITINVIIRSGSYDYFRQNHNRLHSALKLRQLHTRSYFQDTKLKKLIFINKIQIILLNNYNKTWIKGYRILKKVYRVGIEFLKKFIVAGVEESYITSFQFIFLFFNVPNKFYFMNNFFF